eukprot:CAMPEP_0119485218 /NCGR_PEP_ID=MMETSP1344-20130328/11995_1 /TAXON_ID=236787 /ORGANISM="Florenciella parvula, Strain CCMP2471" /LENGTH=59 /DNA_ID=CAMNT_0007519871 /DNA_START=605 /DNA_END=784 /DNA_ORIENTATION=-
MARNVKHHLAARQAVPDPVSGIVFGVLFMLRLTPRARRNLAEVRRMTVDRDDERETDGA